MKETFQINARFAHSTNLEHLQVVRLLTLMNVNNQSDEKSAKLGKTFEIKFQCQLKLF